MFVAPGSAAEECPPAEIRVVPSYDSPDGFEFATGETLRRKSGSNREPLGVIETAVGWDVAVGIRQICIGTICELCVSRIEGRAGFEPGRLLVSASLQGDRCRIDAVVEHEMRHSRVFDESTSIGVETLVDTLARWARRQSPLIVRSESVEAMARTRFDEVEALLEEGVGWLERRARVRNDEIDSPEAYEAERRRIEELCGEKY